MVTMEGLQMGETPRAGRLSAMIGLILRSKKSIALCDCFIVCGVLFPSIISKCLRYGLTVSIVLIFKFCGENMSDKLEATPSEIFDVVPFQESGQLGVAERTENSGLGCAQSSRPWSLPF